MCRQTFHWPKRVCLIFCSLCLPSFHIHAQRLVVPPDPASPPPLATTETNLSLENAGSSPQILKVYPDGTKKIVPLGSLNQRDDGAAYGGPPQLSIYPGPNPVSVLSPQSPERLSVAPIGNSEPMANLNANLPASPDALAETSLMVAADPMGGGPAADPMGGGGSSRAPVDPLSGTTPKTAPPLQTVSGKPAPIVGDTTSVQLGLWDSFFLNAGIGGSLQGQLTARRVWNGTNRQAYPYGPDPNSAYYRNTTVNGENFTFKPGFRLDVEFGYNFYEWLGVGLQTGITYNGIDQYNVTTGQDGYHFSADGELVQVPVQLVGILRWPGEMKLRPFLGGGIGAVWQQLDVNNVYSIDDQGAPLELQGNYCRSAFQFGWNAQAGLTYTVEPGLDFYGAFKMLSAFMPVIGNYQFSNTYNFAVEVGVQSRF